MKTHRLSPGVPLKTGLTMLGLFGALTLASAQTIPNPSFEANSFTNGPGYIAINTQIVGWTTTDPAHAGLNPAAGNAFADNGAVPDGANVAFIQGAANSSLSTVISNLTVGETYKVNFRVNARSNSTPNLKVDIAGANILNSTVTPAGGTNAYKYFAFDFTAAATNQTMTLRNDASTNDVVLVDNFSIALRNSGWSYAAWTNDASSGVVATNTYTHAYAFGANASHVISGVTFTGTGSFTVNPSVAGSFSTAGLSAVFNFDSNNVTGSSSILATDFLYGGSPESITINGLVPGKSYLATIYSVGFDTNGARAATFSVGNDRLTVNQDQFGNDNGIRVSCFYTAGSSRSVPLTYVPLTGSTFHTYGFSNYELSAPNYHAAFLIVTNLADSGPGSLRQVIANTEPGDTITFATNGTIILTSGLLDITKSLNIVGPGPASLVVDGNLAYRVFNLGAGLTSSISGLTIQNGRLQNGGGLGNFGTLVLSNCVITGNASTGPSGFGGAIHNGASGRLSLLACTVSNNHAGDGAAGANGAPGAVGHIDGSAGNPGGPGGNGGGIYNEGVLAITACAVNSNMAGNGGTGGDGGNGYTGLGNVSLGGSGGSGGIGGAGGGVLNAPAATLAMTNCTLWGNSTGNGGPGGTGGSGHQSDGLGGSGGNSGDGGGIYNGSSAAGVVVMASTVTGNGTGAPGSGGLNGGQGSASNGNPGRGGGIKNDGSLALTNTIVATNKLDSPGSFSGANNLTNNADPALAPPHKYGGPTQTMPPLPGSGAIDAGNDSVTNFLFADQRGFPRKIGAHVDIGAAEYTNSPVVTTVADSGGGSLRNAVVFSPDFTTITFDPGLSGKTNVLTSGQLTISSRLTIDASALPSGFKISGNRNSRVFELDSDTPVTLNSLTIQDGSVSGTNGGGILADSGAHLTLTNCTLSGNSAGGSGGNGGGLYIEEGTLMVAGCQFSGNSVGGSGDNGGGALCGSGGTLTINGSTVSSNSATNNGGGVLLINSALLTMNGSAILSNFAKVSGGGIALDADCTLTINNSTVLGNSTSGVFGSGGGGIFLTIDCLLTMNGSAVSSNSAHDGGGIYNYGWIVANNSTFSGNSANDTGGAINNLGGATLVLNSCTLSGNSADSGGAIENRSLATLVVNSCTLSGNPADIGGGGIENGGTLALTNTIVAGNTGPPPANLSGPFAGAYNLTNGNPLLAPLGNYGGPTQTMPPLAGSPAIDAGNDSSASGFLTDQRGFPRLSGAHVDIGAVEAQWAAPGNRPLLTSPARGINGAFSFSFTSAPVADFTVLVTTNVGLPLGQWSILGAAGQYAPGQYLFTDPNATNYPRRFYGVVSP